MAESRIIKTYRDPYGDGFSTTRPTKITLNKGVTILVGCNGLGKSTLITCIEERLDEDDTPYLTFNNMVDGGSNAIGLFTLRGDMQSVAEMACSSEGENITNSLGMILNRAYSFICNKKFESNERWFLFDAVDSGYSIDNVIDLKNVFEMMMDDAKAHDIDLYIVASANGYELANKQNCFDVYSGKYMTFDSYDDYKDYVMESRLKKEKRINTANEKRKKARAKNKHDE